MTDWVSVAAEFPGLDDRTFLDAACVSLLPRRAHEAVRQFSSRLVRPEADSATEHHIWMDQQREQATREVARMLGCGVDQIAQIESTTHGLNIAAQSIPWQAGDDIVMCDLEFLQVAIPFAKLSAQNGVELRFVRHRDGVADVDAYAAKVGPSTRAIVVSSTQWSNGYRIDLSGLAEVAHSVGAWLVVDGIQQAGAVPFDLDGVDFLIAGGHKWLNAPMGTGFMYLSKRVLTQLDPASWGYLALQPPEGGWGRYFSTPDITPDRAYEFVDDAKRFEIAGTANYPGSIALAKSVELVNEIGMDAVAARVWDLGGRLIEGFRRLDVGLETPFEAAHRSGIVSCSLGSRDRDRACLEFLLAKRIFVSQRYTANTGGVRASVHFFNDEDDIDRLLEGIAAFLRS